MRIKHLKGLLLACGLVASPLLAAAAAPGIMFWTAAVRYTTSLSATRIEQVVVHGTDLVDCLGARAEAVRALPRGSLLLGQSDCLPTFAFDPGRLRTIPDPDPDPCPECRYLTDGVIREVYPPDLADTVLRLKDRYGLDEFNRARRDLERQFRMQEFRRELAVIGEKSGER